jgi:hypothetical protein
MPGTLLSSGRDLALPMIENIDEKIPL